MRCETVCPLFTAPTVSLNPNSQPPTPKKITPLSNHGNTHVGFGPNFPGAGIKSRTTTETRRVVPSPMTSQPPGIARARRAQPFPPLIHHHPRLTTFCGQVEFCRLSNSSFLGFMKFKVFLLFFKSLIHFLSQCCSSSMKTLNYNYLQVL